MSLCKVLPMSVLFPRSYTYYGPGQTGAGQIRSESTLDPATGDSLGTTRFAYDLWGESVNLASRLESTGEPGRIQVSEPFRAQASETLIFQRRGEVQLKGVGPALTHWLVGVREAPPQA